MSKTFHFVYFANLGLIVLALLTPLVEWAGHTGGYPWAMKYYAVTLLLSVTLFVLFLGLNVYATIKGIRHRGRYLSAAILTLLWIACGVYQIVYAYSHEIAF